MELHFITINADGAPQETQSELPAPIPHVCAAMIDFYQQVGFAPPWVGYLVQQGGTLVGTCGFKGAPQNGEVEIAYFTFPQFENRGIATAMAQKLIALAQSTDPSVTVTAQTLPEPNASQSVLRKLGFTPSGTAIDHEAGEVLVWHLTNPERE